ncbi:hypothetical protein V2J09_002400 [Rumex salicifolius]
MGSEFCLSAVTCNNNPWSTGKLPAAKSAVKPPVEISESQEFSSEKVIEQFEAITKDAERVQIETLQKILEQNKDVEYLKKLGLNGKTDLDSFKSCVPLANYSDLRPYLDRIAAGEVSGVLTGTPVTTLSLSSGTSEGKPKICPFTEESIDAYVQSLITSHAYRSSDYPVDESKKSLQFLYISKKSKNPVGLVTGLVSAHIISHPKFKQAFKTKRVSPEEVLAAPDPAQALYCHLLLGLKNRHEIQYIFAVFAHNMVAAFQSLEQLWEELCHDIRHGEVSECRVTCPLLRALVETHMGLPDPEAARGLYEACVELRRKGWRRLVPKLFPSAKYVLAVMTGSAQHYLGRVRFFAGEVPLMGMDYGATEGWVATNIHPRSPPEDINFTLIPNIAYFEFIPLDEIKARKDGLGDGPGLNPVGMTEVKVGQTYEIVFTNFQGMYRYRLGDWVKVTGFHNSTPILKFLCRGNVLLSIHIDKTTENDLQLAVHAALDHLSSDHIELVEFTSHAELTPGNEHYVIFLELSRPPADDNDDILRQCSNSMDTALADLGYVTSRRGRTIRPLEVRVVSGGTFRKVEEHFTRSMESCNVVQFKMPRCVKSESMLRILEDNVVGKYFSTAYDP